MKITKNIILTTMIFVVNILYAKQVSRTTGTIQKVVPTQPISSVKQQIQPVFQPIRSPKKVNLYVQALETIRTKKMRPEEVLVNNKFTGGFVTFVKNSVQDSLYADVFAKTLFEAGATLYIILTGNETIDATILVDMHAEIDRQVQLLFLKNMSQLDKVEQQKSTGSAIHLVPTEAYALKEYNLCPLFGNNVGHYSVFNTKSRTSSGKTVARFEYENVNQVAPCVVQLGRYGNWNRTLMQYKTLNQFELADKTGLSPAMCGGLSLNNSRLIRNYVFTGNPQSLNNMHNIQDAAQFLRKLNIGDWLNAEVLRENIALLKQELGLDGINVSAMSTVSLFDSDLDKKPGFAVFDEQEIAYVQQVKRNIRNGLKQNEYVHIMIIGNEEAVESLGHYFCFAIVKVGNQIQYVVLDTIPSAYHLQEGSHERDRLMFVIDNIEKGSSLINVTNLRVRLVS